MSRRHRSASGRATSSVGLGTALVLGIGALLAIGIGFYVAARPDDSAPLAAPVDPRYPDLTMGDLEAAELTIGVMESGLVAVRFPAMIVNVGDGEFLVRASRSHPLAADWRVWQVVSDADGLFSQREALDATLVWGGDGHDHWHVRAVEAHRIETLEGEVLGEVVKAGFCFLDTDAVAPHLPGAPEEHVYSSRGCGGRLDMGVRMGLSVGWGDKYPWTMLDQTVLVPELPDGHYVIRMTADPFDWFAESDETNNEVATEIAISTGDDNLRFAEVVGPAP